MVPAVSHINCSDEWQQDLRSFSEGCGLYYVTGVHESRTNNFYTVLPDICTLNTAVYPYIQKYVSVCMQRADGDR